MGLPGGGGLIQKVSLLRARRDGWLHFCYNQASNLELRLTKSDYEDRGWAVTFLPLSQVLLPPREE